MDPIIELIAGGSALIIALLQIQPGQVVPVRYDPENPSKVTLAL